MVHEVLRIYGFIANIFIFLFMAALNTDGGRGLGKV